MVSGSGRELRCVLDESWRTMRPGRTLGVVVAALLLTAACGGGDDQTLVESQLQNALNDELVPDVRNVDCPEDVDMTAESRFLCEAEVDGQYFEAELTVQDSTGRFTYEKRHAVLDVLSTEASIGDSASVDLGFPVSADCGDTEYLVVSVGNLFSCALANESGVSVSIEVEVVAADGQIDWRPPALSS